MIVSQLKNASGLFAKLVARKRQLDLKHRHLSPWLRNTQSPGSGAERYLHGSHLKQFCFNLKKMNSRKPKAVNGFLCIRGCRVDTFEVLIHSTDKGGTIVTSFEWYKLCVVGGICHMRLSSRVKKITTTKEPGDPLQQGRKKTSIGNVLNKVMSRSFNNPNSGYC